MFFPAADTIAFAEGGTEVMRIDSSGNVGIGVTPSAWDSLYKAIQIGARSMFFGIGSEANLANNAYYNSGYKYVANSAAGLYTIDANVHKWYTAASGTAGNAITFTQAMTLDSSGSLLAGVTSSADSHTFVGKTQNGWSFRVLSDFATQAYGQLISYRNSAPNGVSNEFFYALDTGGTRMTVRSNGGITNYSGNNVNLSDRREKTNFAPAGEYLSKICAIPVQTFNYIDQNMEEDPGLTLGVVAQDVQAVAPELVMESNWGTKETPKMRLSIYQTDLQYALMKCIQEQQTLITSLTARIAALEGAAQ
jgi:hypothetical protein